jgi:uncharacterized protein YgbK (DUF1537 family)
MSIVLGCIADDFTGATDLANTLTRRGMATAVLLGVPREKLEVPEADAIVIALKSRSIPAPDAITLSLAALSWLQRAGARQFFFKYCSTFDSTDAGNIGPVAEALLEALGSDFAVACPAFPTNKRTVYQGYLFVGELLLSESSMRHHPVTPMTDPSLVRVLQRQSRGRVGLIPYGVVSRGNAAIREAMGGLRESGVRLAIADALTDGDLVALGEACADLKLVTGGSGIALGLPENFRRAGLLSRNPVDVVAAVSGPAAVLAGSCSTATQRQVAHMKRHCDAFEIDPIALREGSDIVQRAIEWGRTRMGNQPLLIYSTADAPAVEKVQAALGREQAGHLIEQALGAIAKELVKLGVRRLVIAGGETSGAVVGALGVEGLRIGHEIDPGVPWTTSIGPRPLGFALKSGNFGSDDFFLKALT